MPVTSRSTLKNWFKRGLKPLEVQFASWIDAFYHKDDTDIPITAVQNLQSTLNDLASSASVTALDTAAERKANKGVANGYASLGADGKVPPEQIALVRQNYDDWDATVAADTGYANGDGVRWTDNQIYHSNADTNHNAPDPTDPNGLVSNWVLDSGSVQPDMDSLFGGGSAYPETLVDGATVTWDLANRYAGLGYLSTTRTSITLTLSNFKKGTERTLFVNKQAFGALVLTMSSSGYTFKNLFGDTSSTVTLRGGAGWYLVTFKNMGTANGIHVQLTTAATPLISYKRSKTAHGFSVNDVLTIDNTGQFVKSTSNTDDIVGIVKLTDNTNKFTFQSFGIVDSLNGLTAGSFYYHQTNGSIGTTITNKKVGKALSTTELFLFSFSSESHHRGYYTSLANLNAAVPTAFAGDYAEVDPGTGQSSQLYIWDAQDGWVLSSDGGHHRGYYTSLSNLNTAVATANQGDYAEVDSGSGNGAQLYIWDAQDGWVLSSGSTVVFASQTDAETASDGTLGNRDNTKSFTARSFRWAWDKLLTIANTINATWTFSSSPLVPTAASGDNSTKAASTAFVAAFYNWLFNFATTVTTTTDTLDSARAGQKIRYNNASNITVTIPANATAAIPIGSRFVLRQSGAGKVVVSPAGTVTVNTPDAALLSTQRQYSELTLIKSATDTWELLIEASSFWAWAKTQAQTFTSSITAVQLASTIQTLTDAATIAWDGNLGQNAVVTLGGNRTLAAITNPINGTVYTLRVIQDATGNRTLAFNAAYLFNNSITALIDRRANGWTVLRFWYNGTNFVYLDGNDEEGVIDLGNLTGAVSIDLSLGRKFKCTQTGNWTSFTFTNEVIGRTYSLEITRTSNYSIVFTAGKFRLQLGKVINLTDPASNSIGTAVDRLTFECYVASRLDVGIINDLQNN
jgi:hypothetical protein